MFYQMSIKQFCEAMIYNNDCLLFADIVMVPQHMQSDHPDKPLGRIPRQLLRMRVDVICYWLKKWQGKVVTTIEHAVACTVLW